MSKATYQKKLNVTNVATFICLNKYNLFCFVRIFHILFIFIKVDDELKKIKPKDPKLMTARQRAMLERKTTDKEPGSTAEQLLALPTGQL